MRCWKLGHASTVVLAVCAVLGTFISSCQLQTQINQLATVLTTRQTAGRELAGVYIVIRESEPAGIGLDEISRQFQIAEAAKETVEVPLVAGDETSARAVADLIGLGIVARRDDGKYQLTAQGQNTYLPANSSDTDPSKTPDQNMLDEETLVQESLDREELDQEESDHDTLRQEIVALLSQRTEGLDVDEVFAELSQRDIDVAWKIFNLVVHELAAQGIVRQTEEGNLVTVLRP